MHCFLLSCFFSIVYAPMNTGGCWAPRASTVAKPMTHGDGAGATGDVVAHLRWRCPAHPTDLLCNFAEAWRLVCGRLRATPLPWRHEHRHPRQPRPADLGSAMHFGLFACTGSVLRRPLATAEQKRAVSSSYRYTGTEYGIPVLMISESLISLSELIMHA